MLNTSSRLWFRPRVHDIEQTRTGRVPESKFLKDTQRHCCAAEAGIVILLLSSISAMAGLGLIGFSVLILRSKVEGFRHL